VAVLFNTNFRLISLVRKDDYAFFLKPVDTEKVPGYLDVIPQPMDFGKMTEKVAKSKYRSLDEFAVRTHRFRFHLTRSPLPKGGSQPFFGSQEDFRLVISNAKTFNPPGTIYHTEAERIEAWASDHISKAASCVIEYETEWNIDVDRDEDVNVDADEDAAGPGRTGSVGPDTPARRSPSVLSASVPPINRRGGRNAAAKKEGIVSETIEPDGHLPGFKDGVGVFPPESDWAEVMLALKLKGTFYIFLF
jgi:bromodomain-containing protein 7